MTQESNYVELPLEEVIGDRFGRYSKYIIQDRALPDVRDGLKPVQRRILYAMHEDGNTHDKNFRKAAKTVGNVIGNFHPHGDTSVYDAMVRLSQDWKMRSELVEMHGNNGSIDGDPAAAMRYTEARLSKISANLLLDIEKETVDFIPNFDDTQMEPVVFPAKFPNLLVNGSTGISAGYATDIPPHNLKEVIDGVIKMIDKPEITVSELLKVIKGPDFPTGGIVQGKEGIKQAFETGKGRVILRGKASIEKMRGRREQIVIYEIPYEVNKANLVRKIDEISIDRKVEGISEVRDETDRTGLRIVIELRQNADSQGILNYLYKHTDLQVSYHYNMVAIQDKTPKLLSMPQILQAYIEHQKDVKIKQTSFDLNKAMSRAHIVEGLIKAISVLDELIAKIRESKNKQDAKERIKKSFGFTEEQAEAIVTLQLYRLTNTDIVSLEEESEELAKEISLYESILNDEQKLLATIKMELKEIQKEFGEDRRTKVEEEIEELEIDIEVTVASENVLVSVTHEGYIKRTSLRSYTASDGEDFAIKDEDNVVRLMEINTTDHILIFTNKGRFINVPVHQLPDIRWKDLGQHISNLSSIDQDEYVVECISVRDFKKDHYLVFFTKDGMVKKSDISLYNAKRFARPLIAVNLKGDDEVINVYETDGTKEIMLATNTGYGLRFSESEINPVGQRALGVIGMNLKDDESIVNGHVFDNGEEPFIVLVTHRGACKRMRMRELPQANRARRGLIMLRELKGNPHRLRGFFLTKERDHIGLQTDKEINHEIRPFDLPISDRYSNGSFVVDTGIDGEVDRSWLIAKYEQVYEENK